MPKTLRTPNTLRYSSFQAHVPANPSRIQLQSFSKIPKSQPPPVKTQKTQTLKTRSREEPLAETLAAALAAPLAAAVLAAVIRRLGSKGP